MNTRLTLAAIGILAVSAAVAADLVMRPGRWEMTAQLDFGGRQIPQGMPLAEPMTSVACITADEVKKIQGPIPVPEGCRVSEYEARGKEISFIAHCEEEVMVNYKLTFHSPENFSGITTSHGRDASQTMTMKLSGKRTGDACSAKELAEYNEKEE